MLWWNQLFFNGIDGSRKDEKMCKMTKEVGSQNPTGKMQMWTGYEWTVISGSADKVTGICLEEKIRTPTWQADSPTWYASAHDASRVHEFLVKISITKMDHPSNSPDLAPLDVCLFPKLKNEIHVGAKICWYSWHPLQCDITVKYSRKRDSRLFPAVAPMCHKVHSFTRRIFRRWQRLPVHR
jgi:hypothetical protein